jgi:hypothetical protein
VQIERGPGRGLSQTPRGRARPGSGPKSVITGPTPPNKKTKTTLFDCVGAVFKTSRGVPDGSGLAAAGRNGTSPNPSLEVTESSLSSKGPRKLSRIRPEIFDFEPELGLQRRQTKPKIPGMVPTDRHTTIPNDYGPISSCFDDDPSETFRLRDSSAEETRKLRGEIPRGKYLITFRPPPRVRHKSEDPLKIKASPAITSLTVCNMNSILCNSASGREIGLPGWISRGDYSGHPHTRPSGRPLAGRRADFEALPTRIRPKSGPEARFPARKQYCVT